MGKHGKYAKHYKDEWEKLPDFCNWLARSHEEGKGEAYCKICRTSLRAQKNDLVKHMNTKMHKETANNLKTKSQPKISTYGPTTKLVKINDIKLVTHIALHASIRSIDHLGELLKSMGSGSPLEKLKLHSTKCSSIVKNVLEPTLLKEMIADIGDGPYSIILDESTDVACEKYMAYMVRYYNQKEGKIIVDFLGFQEVYQATAEALYDAFNEFLDQHNLKKENLIGLGTDGASNLCGVRHSLYTLLQADIPHLQLLKCVCHSLSLCAAKAAEELPTSLEYLLRETRNWFSHSSLRLKNYALTYQLLYDNKKPPKLTQLSATRWLAYYAAVNANVKQWLPLKTHFNMMVSSGERCYQARELSNMYDDDTHLLYLLFLAPVLKDITDVNMAFQSDSSTIVKLYSDLRSLLLTTARRVFKPIYLNVQSSSATPGMLQEIHIEAVKTALEKSDAQFGNSVLELESIDLGSMFEDKARIVNNPQKVRGVREKCKSFLLRLCTELVKRLPQNVRIVQSIDGFAPNKACSMTIQAKAMDLPWTLAKPGYEKSEIERQWRLLGTMKVEEIDPDLKQDVSADKFWVAVANFKNSAEINIFKDIADFALRALSLPISNATVERVFSVMGTIKTKLRNRMQLPTLVAITRVRMHLKARNICCNTFEPSAAMINLHNSDVLYKKKAASVETDVPPNPNIQDDFADVLLLLADEEDEDDCTF